MKKAIPAVLLLTTLLLSACSNPFSKPESFEVVVASHSKALVGKLYPEIVSDKPSERVIQGTVSWETSSWKILWEFRINTKTTGKDAEENITLSGSLENPLADPKSKQSIGLDLSFVQKSGSGFIFLKALDANIEGFALWEIMQDFKSKWFSLDGEYEGVTPFKQVALSSFHSLVSPTHEASEPVKNTTENKKNMLDAAKYRATLENNNIFKLKKDLGRENGMYRYEVTLDQDKFFEVQKGIYEATTGAQMTPENIALLKKDISTSTLEGTLSVDDANREYGSFKGRYTYVDGEKPASEDIEYRYSKDDIYLSTNSDDGVITLDLKRTLLQYKGNLSITSKKDKVSYPIGVEVSKKWEGFTIQLTYAQSSPTPMQEIISGKLNVEVQTVAKPDVTISAPANSSSLAKAISAVADSFTWGEDQAVE